jgi:hypothetical protein
MYTRLQRFHQLGSPRPLMVANLIYHPFFQQKVCKKCSYGCQTKFFSQKIVVTQSLWIKTLKMMTPISLLFKKCKTIFQSTGQFITHNIEHLNIFMKPIRLSIKKVIKFCLTHSLWSVPFTALVNTCKVLLYHECHSVSEAKSVWIVTI